MISKIKDLSALALNNQDVMVKARLLGKKTSLLLPDDMSQKMKDELGGEWEFSIVALGKEVTAFEIGQIVSMKKASGEYHLEDESNQDSNRFIVMHMANVEFGINPDNYLG